MANLIDNAAQHNLANGHLEVRTATELEHATLTVSNTGVQIRDDQAHRLTEPFQRLGSARGVAGDGHHGLGLSIVRAIALAHDGTLTVRPRDGGGLTVSVAFRSQDAAATGPADYLPGASAGQ